MAWSRRFSPSEIPGRNAWDVAPWKWRAYCYQLSNTPATTTHGIDTAAQLRAPDPDLPLVGLRRDMQPDSHWPSLASEDPIAAQKADLRGGLQIPANRRPRRAPTGRPARAGPAFTANQQPIAAPIRRRQCPAPAVPSTRLERCAAFEPILLRGLPDFLSPDPGCLRRLLAPSRAPRAVPDVPPSPGRVPAPTHSIQEADSSALGGDPGDLQVRADAWRHET